MKKAQTRFVWTPDPKAEIIHKHLEGIFRYAGWRKNTTQTELLFLETTDDVPSLLDKYVYYFNNRQPAAALGYKSPAQHKTELSFYSYGVFSVYSSWQMHTACGYL